MQIIHQVVQVLWGLQFWLSNSHPIYYAYKGASNYIDVLNTDNETYGNCTTCANFVATSAGSHSGKWRPDYR